MSNDATKTAEILDLVELTKEHLAAEGHAVDVEPNDQITAFEVTPAGRPDEVICRIQAVGDQSWEMVMTNGQTLTGMGGEEVFRAMIGRTVADAMRRRAA
ncbi:MAG: hypothetical protein AAGI70_03455 [Pseudomonadota bacterium]